MKLKWKHVCHKCQAPLDPSIIARTKESRVFLRWYRHIRPIFMMNNDSRYSFIGLKLYRVCFSCFKLKTKPSVQNLKSRELGLVKRVIPKSKAKTEEEICTWFHGLLREAAKQNIRYR